jgi:hypothetical protein
LSNGKAFDGKKDSSMFPKTIIIYLVGNITIPQTETLEGFSPLILVV